MSISRHFVDIEGRRVHYRRAGKGPPVLMVHQSPRSSAEYESLMLEWSDDFTLIAPDTPGFGQSDPLPGEPDIAAFADAIVAFLDAIGLGTVGAYGFHSGGIILATVLKRHPGRFTALAIGGYAVWTDEEREIFDSLYLPPFQPEAHGEHLAWLWGRITEQSWFFPWYDVREEARLTRPHSDPAKVDAVVREMLDSGDAYRAGYGAVLRASRDLPGEHEDVPPVLITAYDGDPLQAHLERLGALPKGWEAHSVTTIAEHHAESLAWLRHSPAPQAGRLNEAADAGFVKVAAGAFEGRIHWEGNKASDSVLLHAPGGSIATAPCAPLRIDLPGHGLSDDFADGPATLDDWVEAVASAIRAVATVPVLTIVGEGISALLALAVARAVGVDRVEAVGAHVPLEELSEAWLSSTPDLAPDRFGNYLAQAWQIARASRLFWPWFEVAPENAIPFDSSHLSPERLAADHRSVVRGRRGKALTTVLLQADRNKLVAEAPTIGSWALAPWARKRTDIWKPETTKGEG
jgi:pimeloyl-ACP methyl ester carboxylesterase